MAQTHFRSKRKVSGKKYISFRKKRLSDLGGSSAQTHIGNRKEKIKRGRGGNIKKSLLRTEYVIVNNGAKAEKLKIDGVSHNPANIHYTRRNIITKGSVVKTQKGEVRITSRPGQNGALFGVLITK